MASYTNEQLRKRNSIIKTQPAFISFLNKEIVNKLVHLFDTTYNKANNISSHKITKYVMDERKLRGLDDRGIIVRSKVYSSRQTKYNLLLVIEKNNKDLLHLSVHISPEYLTPQATGMIHIYKDMYEDSYKLIHPEKFKRGRFIPEEHRKLYALIKVEQPPNKKHSLIFSIEDGYDTHGIDFAEQYDPALQQEMDVIVAVLNKVFDETNKEYYIGDVNAVYPIHNITNAVLNNVNRCKLGTRKNTGEKLGPLYNNCKYDITEIRRPTRKSKAKNGTRKIRSQNNN